VLTIHVEHKFFLVVEIVNSLSPEDIGLADSAIDVEILKSLLRMTFLKMHCSRFLKTNSNKVAAAILTPDCGPSSEIDLFAAPEVGNTRQ